MQQSESPEEAVPMARMIDTSLHERRRSERRRDPEYRAAYDRAAGEIQQIDEVIRALDELRVDLGMSKAELARRIDRNASSIRRLFTAQQARPELGLVAAIADALGAEVRVVPKAKAPNGRNRPRARGERAAA
jgi:ribosome-binding protein aMBF1 (putative translation factor)